MKTKKFEIKTKNMSGLQKASFWRFFFELTKWGFCLTPLRAGIILFADPDFQLSEEGQTKIPQCTKELTMGIGGNDVSVDLLPGGGGVVTYDIVMICFLVSDFG